MQPVIDFVGECPLPLDDYTYLLGVDPDRGGNWSFSPCFGLVQPRVTPALGRCGCVSATRGPTTLLGTRWCSGTRRSTSAQFQRVRCRSTPGYAPEVYLTPCQGYSDTCRARGAATPTSELVALRKPTNPADLDRPITLIQRPLDQAPLTQDNYPHARRNTRGRHHRHASTLVSGTTGRTSQAGQVVGSSRRGFGPFTCGWG